MVKCDDCKKEMSDSSTKTCNQTHIKIDGEWHERNTSYFDEGKFCHDCNIENQEGNFHHFGCDMERCPKCEGQLISCECNIEFLGIKQEVLLK